MAMASTMESSTVRAAKVARLLARKRHGKQVVILDEEKLKWEIAVLCAAITVDWVVLIGAGARRLSAR